MKIAIDAMGGDHGPPVTIGGLTDALNLFPELEATVFGLEESTLPHLKNHGLIRNNRVDFEHSSEIVKMDDKPAIALRSKKDSSMRRAIDSVKSGGSNACVSAGNTGALMGIARFVLKTMPGISRPAICGTMPGIEKTTKLLDLGANVDCSSEDLLGFAIMGSVLARFTSGIEQPRVALLNIGMEQIKGNEQIRKASEILEKSHINYVGYVEGDDIFKGSVDVIVCDGFIGNIALKASEGAAKMLSEIAKEEYSKNLLTKLSGLLSLPVLGQLKERVDPRRHNGASLLGLKGTVVKSHGSADELSFSHAIQVAISETKQKIPEKIGELMGETEFALGDSSNARKS